MSLEEKELLKEYLSQTYYNGVSESNEEQATAKNTSNTFATTVLTISHKSKTSLSRMDKEPHQCIHKNSKQQTRQEFCQDQQPEESSNQKNTNCQESQLDIHQAREEIRKMLKRNGPHPLSVCAQIDSNYKETFKVQKSSDQKHILPNKNETKEEDNQCTDGLKVKEDQNQKYQKQNQIQGQEALQDLGKYSSLEKLQINSSSQLNGNPSAVYDNGTFQNGRSKAFSGYIQQNTENSLMNIQQENPNQADKRTNSQGSIQTNQIIPHYVINPNQNNNANINNSNIHALTMPPSYGQFPTLQNMTQMQNLQSNLPSLQNMQNMQNMANLQNILNFQNNNANILSVQNIGGNYYYNQPVFPTQTANYYQNVISEQQKIIAEYQKQFEKMSTKSENPK